MKCPRIECNEILRFDDLSEEECAHFIENIESYQI